MCSVCDALLLDRCPPVASRPPPGFTEELVFEQTLHDAREHDPEPPTVDGVTELVLRAHLNPPPHRRPR